MNWIVLALVLMAGMLVGLRSWALADGRAATEVWRRLIRTAPADPACFDPSAIADLPEPARRFLGATMRPGTPLRTVAEITMHGELGLGTKADPAYRSMRACQILAAPEGFIWQVATGPWPLGLAGSDGAIAGRSWTRFRMAGLVPVARVGDDPDHLRSSFGRYISDAIIWTPAALMPSSTVRWEGIGPDSARVTVTHGDLVQAIDLTLDSSGRPVRMTFERWSDANADKVYRLQPFGGELSAFREFEGFTVPTRVEAGNHFGTDAYFPFFKATVDGVRYIDSPDASRGCASP